MPRKPNRIRSQAFGSAAERLEERAMLDGDDLDDGGIVPTAEASDEDDGIDEDDDASSSNLSQLPTNNDDDDDGDDDDGDDDDGDDDDEDQSRGRTIQAPQLPETSSDVVAGGDVIQLQPAPIDGGVESNIVTEPAGAPIFETGEQDIVQTTVADPVGETNSDPVPLLDSDVDATNSSTIPNALPQPGPTPAPLNSNQANIIDGDRSTSEPVVSSNSGGQSANQNSNISDAENQDSIDSSESPGASSAASAATTDIPTRSETDSASELSDGLRPIENSSSGNSTGESQTASPTGSSAVQNSSTAETGVSNSRPADVSNTNSSPGGNVDFSDDDIDISSQEIPAEDSNLDSVESLSGNQPPTSNANQQQTASDSSGLSQGESNQGFEATESNSIGSSNLLSQGLGNLANSTSGDVSTTTPDGRPVDPVASSANSTASSGDTKSPGATLIGDAVENGANALEAGSAANSVGTENIAEDPARTDSQQDLSSPLNKSDQLESADPASVVESSNSNEVLEYENSELTPLQETKSANDQLPVSDSQLQPLSTSESSLKKSSRETEKSAPTQNDTSLENEPEATDNPQPAPQTQQQLDVENNLPRLNAFLINDLRPGIVPPTTDNFEFPAVEINRNMEFTPIQPVDQSRPSIITVATTNRSIQPPVYLANHQIDGPRDSNSPSGQAVGPDSDPETLFESKLDRLTSRSSDSNAINAPAESTPAKDLSTSQTAEVDFVLTDVDHDQDRGTVGFFKAILMSVAIVFSGFRTDRIRSAGNKLRSKHDV